MPNLSIEYTFQGRSAPWFVGVIFSFVGVFLGLILPWMLTPRVTPQSIRVDGVVDRISWEEGEGPEGTYFPIFTYALPEKGGQTFRAGISSNRPSFEVGEKVTVVVDPNDVSTAFVEGDKDLQIALWILRFLAVVFFGIGITVVILLLRGTDTMVVNRIGGLLGALSFSLPSILALPALWFAFEHRPNLLFRREDTFGTDMLLIGCLFSGIGVIVTVLTFMLYRYQARTGKAGWSWSWSSDGKTK